MLSGYTSVRDGVAVESCDGPPADVAHSCPFQSGIFANRPPDSAMLVRLTRKLADHVDGIDLSDVAEGDVIDLPRHEAERLIAEQWALPFRGPAPRQVRGTSSPTIRAVAADAPARRRTVAQLRRLRKHMEHKRFADAEHRRAEDHIRDELHDSHAVTISANKNRS